MHGLYDIPVTSPTNPTSDEGLQRIRQIVYDERRTAADPAAVFQLPEVFWNHLTRDSVVVGGCDTVSGSGPGPSSSMVEYTTLFDQDHGWNPIFSPLTADGVGNFAPTADSLIMGGLGQSDQSDISAALIRFITDSAGNAQ